MNTGIFGTKLTMNRIIRRITYAALVVPALVALPAIAQTSISPVNDPIRETETHIYKKVDNRSLKLFIEKPRQWQAADRRPAIVFFFGGGWVGGSTEQFRKESEYLASRGMVGIRVEYRTIPKGVKGPPTICVQDAKSAMRWVRSHASELGVDPQRIAASGGSAGGHLAAFTGLVKGIDAPDDDLTVSAQCEALVLWNPVFNNGPGEWGHELVGDRYKEFSPAHNVTSNAPPAIVFLGTKDQLVPVTVVKKFQEDMKSVGVRCETIFYEGQGHGFFNRQPWLSETLTEADKFLTSLGWLSSAPASTDLPAAKPEPKSSGLRSLEQNAQSDVAKSAVRK